MRGNSISPLLFLWRGWLVVGGWGGASGGGGGAGGGGVAVCCANAVAHKNAATSASADTKVLRRRTFADGVMLSFRFISSSFYQVPTANRYLRRHQWVTGGLAGALDFASSWLKKL